MVKKTTIIPTISNAPCPDNFDLVNGVEMCLRSTAMPDQAGAQYVTFATTVARPEHILHCREVDGVP